MLYDPQSAKSYGAPSKSGRQLDLHQKKKLLYDGLMLINILQRAAQDACQPGRGSTKSLRGKYKISREKYIID